MDNALLDKTVASFDFTLYRKKGIFRLHELDQETHSYIGTLEFPETEANQDPTVFYTSQWRVLMIAKDEYEESAEAEVVLSEIPELTSETMEIESAFSAVTTYVRVSIKGSQFTHMLAQFPTPFFQDITELDPPTEVITITYRDADNKGYIVSLPGITVGEGQITGFVAKDNNGNTVLIFEKLPEAVGVGNSVSEEMHATALPVLAIRALNKDGLHALIRMLETTAVREFGDTPVTLSKITETKLRNFVHRLANNNLSVDLEIDQHSGDTLADAQSVIQSIREEARLLLTELNEQKESENAKSIP
jgi:hypothetical protein